MLSQITVEAVWRWTDGVKDSKGKKINKERITPSRQERGDTEEEYQGLEEDIAMKLSWEKMEERMESRITSRSLSDQKQRSKPTRERILFNFKIKLVSKIVPFSRSTNYKKNNNNNNNNLCCA